MKRMDLPDLQIIELFLVKCGNDWTRTFMGQLERVLDADGNHLIYGKVEIEGYIVKCIGKTEEEIGDTLDSLCDLILNSDISNLEEVKSDCGIIEIHHN
jgi:hypothetical protein